MTVMSRSLERRMKAIAGKSLKITQAPNCNATLFRSQMGDEDEFCLYYEVLTEFEILEVTKIVAKVYSDFPEDTPRVRSASSSKRDLSSSTELSGQFVGAVIDLEGSALHKLLLLTSGNRMLSQENFEMVTILAQVKKQARFYPDDMSQGNVYNYLKNTYILPGVSVRTVMPGGGSISMDSHEKNSIAQAACLMAFLANNSESLTLGEHLNLNLTEAFSTQKSLKDFSGLSAISEVLRLSNYKKLVESMTASELSSLICILDDATLKGQFPETILRSRSAAMESDVRPLTRYGLDSILRYLSKNEQKSLSSMTFSEHLNELLNNRDMKTKVPPIVYAALAEVFAAKGAGKALEVARTLEHLRHSKDRNLKMYEATVAIIAEALSFENDELPFGWLAQLSEHAWVLSSHRKERNRRDGVIESF